MAGAIETLRERYVAGSGAEDPDRAVQLLKAELQGCGIKMET